MPDLCSATPSHCLLFLAASLCKERLKSCQHLPEGETQSNTTAAAFPCRFCPCFLQGRKDTLPFNLLSRMEFFEVQWGLFFLELRFLWIRKSWLFSCCFLFYPHLYVSEMRLCVSPKPVVRECEGEVGLAQHLGEGWEEDAPVLLLSVHHSWK